ncbi:MAG: hypothetical protein FWF10_02385 [Clostridiales bacterium]|nr:hypothetical protein [Clostridiales bacterium]
MSKESRQARREAEMKRKKKNRIILIVVIAAILVLAAIIGFSVYRQSQIRVYSGGGQTVTLYSNGSFTASLSHGVNRAGAYTETIEGDTITITFSYGNTSASGTIAHNVLTLPDAWDDGHGHGSKLGLTKGRGQD